MPKQSSKKITKKSQTKKSEAEVGEVTVAVIRHESITKRSRLARLLLIVGVVCAVVAGVLALRIAARWYYQPPLRPRETNVETISPWMTLGYVSRTYGVPLPELEAGIGLELGGHHKKSLEDVAAQQGQSTPELMTTVKEVVSSFQKTHPTPPPK